MSNFIIYRLTAAYGAQHLVALAKRLRVNESGQDIVEYAGMLAIIAAVVVLILQLQLPHIISTALGDAVKTITQSSGSGSKPAGS